LPALLLAALLAAAVAGCASTGSGRDDGDPLEPLNRQVFAFNDAVDTLLLYPAAVVYREAAPDFLKDMVSNFLDHLTLPLTIVHDLLQGEPDRASVAFARLFINTVVGIGGLFDPATSVGYRRHREDAGQTLAVYGVGSGPYIVLPLLGPSSLRDATGTLIDTVADPIGLWSSTTGAAAAVRWGRAGAGGLVRREKSIEALNSLRQSLDYYTAVRAAYLQRRQVDIRNGTSPPPSESQDDPFATAE